ncbi:long-chain fatty acid--CoA ligase [Jatrophihabitans telluris]|uniref:Long-chain fatty acid--CoA ligase n=1 Tax=Jatrophihabitans telluris TaxID=2038343 RepID=A0ABY4QTL9_9ACTN|nr:long-chain fatty acid--CoA ligase [Jatrophihabitans telluris]UQX86875.1 long-chain fatty acid--CoA ligase [Jatrophihabitans telluris]
MTDNGLGSWPRRRAGMTPDKAALVQDGAVTTYAQLERATTRLAHGLRAHGVARADRVAFLGMNSVEMVIAMFATARIGAVYVPLNTRLAPPELGYLFEHSGADLLLVEDTLSSVAEQARAGASGPDMVVFSRQAGSGLDGLMSEDDSPIEEEIGLDDLFMIQYTSGTSGLPKGVMLTHGNVIWNVYNLLVDIDLGSDEIALVTAPLFHTAALNQVLFPTVLKGGTALIEAKFDAAQAIDLIEGQRVTLLFGVTTMYLALSQSRRFHEADLSSLHLALSGGSPIPESLLQTWLDRGLMIVQGYGLTEASPGTTMLRAADGVRKLGSAGTACFFTDVRVVAGERDADVGEPGEVLVRGPNVSPGYWQDVDATERAFTNGWLHTGDVATRDAEGYLRIVDRLKDMYISGGENVYPAEVEQALYTHVAVAECAVIGVADATWGEVGHAFVVVREEHHLDADELLRHVGSRLARYKVPKSVEFVPDLPHNASGKLLRSRLRKALS